MVAAVRATAAMAAAAMAAAMGGWARRAGWAVVLAVMAAEDSIGCRSLGSPCPSRICHTLRPDHRRRIHHPTSYTRRCRQRQAYSAAVVAAVVMGVAAKVAAATAAAMVVAVPVRAASP